jgi:transcriptional regulator with XRE-family HTH domain
MVQTAMLIRSARRRAGITQAELAARAGTSAPTISAYEHGTKQPRADVLLRLLRAAGLEPALVPATTANSRYIDSYCEALAQRVRRDPTVLDRAARELDRMSPSSNVDTWRSLLAAGPAAVIAVLTSRDPDARTLKADNPFARLGLIDEDARLALVQQAHAR